LDPDEVTNSSDREIYDDGNIATDWGEEQWERYEDSWESCGKYQGGSPYTVTSQTQSVLTLNVPDITLYGYTISFDSPKINVQQFIGSLKDLLYAELSDPDENTRALYDTILDVVSFVQRSELKERDGKFVPELYRIYDLEDGILNMKLRGFRKMNPQEDHVIQAMDETNNPIFHEQGWHVYAGRSRTYGPASSGVLDGKHVMNVGTNGEGNDIISKKAIGSNAKTLPEGAGAGGVAGALGVFTPSSILKGQAVFSFRGRDRIDTLVLPSSKGNIIKYRLKEDLGSKRYKMETDDPINPDIIVDFREEGIIKLEAVDTGEVPLVIALGDETAVTHIRGAQIQSSYEVSDDVYGNKIMLVDFEDRIISEGITLEKTTGIIEAIKRFLEEKMGKPGVIADRLREAIDNFSGLDKFVKWLTQMGTYIINCAVRATRIILSQQGINLGIEEIALDMILLDLMDGNLNPRTTSILYTTFSTIQKIAGNNGVNLKTMFITRNQLEQITSPVIAHVGGDHAVIVTGVYEGKVDVIESDGKLYEIPIERFLEQWSGYVMAERAPPMTSLEDIEASLPEVSSPLTRVIVPDEDGKITIPLISTPEEKLTPLAIEERLKKALEQEETPGSPKVLLRGSDPIITTNTFGDTTIKTSFDSENGTFDIVTTIGIDGSLTYTENVVEYEYDEDGTLIGATGEGVTWGEDIFGNSYVTTSVDTYIILEGQAKKTRSDAITESQTLDGSTSTSTGVIIYEYTDGTEDPESLPPEYLDEDGNVLIGLLKHAEGGSTTIGQDAFGNVYTTSTQDTYTIINGEAKVEETSSITENQTISGTITQTQAVITYIYTDGTEPQVYPLPPYFDEDGNVIVGILKDASGYNESFSEDVFGNRYTSTTNDSYIIAGGHARVIRSDTVTASTNLNGLINTSTGYIEYEYSTIGEPYINPNTERSGVGVVIGGSGENISVGEDIFGNTFTTTTTNEYVVTLRGQPRVGEARSLIETENFDGSIRREESVLMYEYTDGTEDPDSLPEEYLDEDGNVFLGLLKRAEGYSNSYSEDVFGNRYTTSSGNTYTYEKGEAFVDRVETITMGEDTFGNSYTTTSWVDYLYGSLAVGEEGALRDADFVMIGADGGSFSEGEDVYGASYFATTTNTYVFNKGQVYIDVVNNVTTGSDAFGTTYTTASTLDYVYGSLSAGEEGALRDADFILIDASGGNESDGMDIFGSEYHSTTTNTYTYYKGQVYVEFSDTVNTGSDTFGSSYTTTSFIDYEYGPLSAGDEGALRNAEFVLIGATGGSTNLSHSIFGEDTSSVTVNTYRMIRGQVVVDTAEVTTTGTNLFGEEYTTSSTTIYIYYEGQPGPNAVYGELQTALTDTLTTGSDIWGASYVTTSQTNYTIVNNRALALNVTSETAGENLFGESYSTETTTTYSYYDGQEGPNAVYGELQTALTDTLTTGSDIWGATYVTNSHTEYTIINNRALAWKVTSTTTGENLL
jgi:hypothetical protein